MNTYEITFTRENGSTGKDRITAANEKQARKDFREIYRHSSATITDVIVAAENVPASKQQERDALDQIRAIVDTLGPDSYLATAFAGCFEDAEENIKNDFACSMKQRLESAEAKRIEAELGYNRLVDKLAESEKALEAARADIEKKDEEIAALDARISAIQRPAEPAEISDELLADLATFSSVYIERIQKAIIENVGQIAKNATLVRLLHQYSTRLEQERIEYAREVYNSAKHGTEFRPSNKCLTHASSYYRELGLYAEDPDPEVGEVLYCYGNCGDLAEWIPPSGGATIVEKTIDIVTAIGTATNVTAYIPADAYATKEDYETYKAIALGAQATAEEALALARQAIAITQAAEASVNDLSNTVGQNTSKIATLWDAVFSEITSNPFQITFVDLSGITLSSGIWNATLQRLEC